MHHGRTPGWMTHLCMSLLIFTATVSTTSAAPQKLVIDEHVNPRWIDADQLEFSRTVDGKSRRLRINRKSGVISNASAGVEGAERAPGRRVTRSTSRGGDVPIIFKNDTTQPIRIMWVNNGGDEVP